MHFTVAPESALGRNLQRDDRVAFTVCAATHAVMGRGTAVLVARALDAPELIDLLAEAAAAGRFTPSGWDGLIDRIELERVFAN